MERIADAYDRWSASYDSQSNETRDLDESVLHQIVPDLSGLTVVECGCGTGKNSAWLAPRCTRLLGLDFSLGMLSIARKKLHAANVLLAQHDLRFDWPIADGAADVVLFNLVLEHIPDLAPVFAEAGRALRMGGTMALSEYHPSRVVEGKGPVVKDANGQIEERIPNFLHTLADYTRAAESAGLSLVSSASWSESGTPMSSVEGSWSEDTRPQLLSMLFRKSR